VFTEEGPAGAGGAFSPPPAVGEEALPITPARARSSAAEQPTSDPTAARWLRHAIAALETADLPAQITWSFARKDERSYSRDVTDSPAATSTTTASSRCGSSCRLTASKTRPPA
jgi:hypothetical protein